MLLRGRPPLIRRRCAGQEANEDVQNYGEPHWTQTQPTKEISVRDVLDRTQTSVCCTALAKRYKAAFLSWDKAPL